MAESKSKTKPDDPTRTSSLTENSTYKEVEPEKTNPPAGHQVVQEPGRPSA